MAVFCDARHCEQFKPRRSIILCRSLISFARAAEMERAPRSAAGRPARFISGSGCQWGQGDAWQPPIIGREQGFPRDYGYVAEPHPPVVKFDRR
jgi:hypothetical protein